MELSIRNCQFAIRCDRQWAQLRTTSNDEVRYCDKCQHDVYWCQTDRELAEAVALNRCVAIEVAGFLGEVEMGLVAGPRGS